MPGPGFFPGMPVANQQKEVALVKSTSKTMRTIKQGLIKRNAGNLLII